MLCNLASFCITQKNKFSKKFRKMSLPKNYLAQFLNYFQVSLWLFKGNSNRKQLHDSLKTLKIVLPMKAVVVTAASVNTNN